MAFFFRSLKGFDTAERQEPVRHTAGCHDPVRHTDEARKLIGAALLALLIAVVLLGFAAFFVLQFHTIDTELVAAIRSDEDAERLAAVLKIAGEESKANAERLALLLNIVFGPVVTLLGSVTGFYFGSARAPSR